MPCFLFLQDLPFFLFYFFFCNLQQKIKSIYNKSLASLTPIHNRLFLSSQNRRTSWQVPYGLTKTSKGEFKVDVGEQTNSKVKKQKKKQSQFFFTTDHYNKQNLQIDYKFYSSKINQDFVVFTNL